MPRATKPDQRDYVAWPGQKCAAWRETDSFVMSYLTRQAVLQVNGSGYIIA